MNKTLLLLFALLLTQVVTAQFLTLNGNIVIGEASTEGAKIIIFKNSEKIDEQIISKKGRFEAKLALDADYRLSFEKEGYITKSVSVNTEVPTEIIETNPNFPPVKLIINLLPKVENVDLTIFEQPIAILTYNYELDDFTFDKEYSDRIKDRVAQTEKEVRRVMSQKGSAALEQERLFAELIGKGQTDFDRKQWGVAIDTWKQALALKPDNQDVKTRIEQAEKEKELENARKSIEQQNELAYKLLVASGDSLFHLKKYSEAKDKFTDAIKLNKQDTYPPKKISEINALFAQEADQQKQIAEMEANYKKVITSADNAYNTKDYTAAITAYRQAIVLKPSDTYPRERIAKAEQEQAKIKQQVVAEQEQKRKEEQRRLSLKNDYDKIIAEADLAFKTENYALAKLRYTDADNLNLGEEYPKKQLLEIENIINSSKYKAKLAEYNKNKGLAEKAMSAQSYASAKFYYQQAIAILPIDRESIDKKISEIDRLIEAEQLAAINKEYQEHIDKADKASKEKSYAVAKFYYQKALGLKKDDKYAKEKLVEVEKQIGERKEKSVEL